MYEHGLGVVQDYRKARQLYALALAQGFTPVTARLKELDEKIGSECPLLGKRLVITGTSRKDLNGRTGVATSFDHDRDRYVVELDSREGENEKERLKVKPENLSLTKIGRKQEKKRGK